jgi:hypothetical protein
MTNCVHIANTNVEFEMAQFSGLSLEKAWHCHAFCLQLQFLPLLYAQSTDKIAVTHLPDPEFLTALSRMNWWLKGTPSFILLDDMLETKGICYSWGASQQVETWAKIRGLRYDIPDNWEMLRQINSKAFSFRYSYLPSTCLLYNEQELRNWVKKVQGVKILKSCYGVSGKGNRLIKHDVLSEKILAFCRHEWEQQRPLIAEPYVRRCLDFSTQWYIHSKEKIEWKGTTRFEVDTRGSYQGTMVGKEEILFPSFFSYIEKHKEIAYQSLTEIAEKGYFGPVGIDAFVYYNDQQKKVLQPIGEINARQTMSSIALAFQKKLPTAQILHLFFAPVSVASCCLLPHLLLQQGEKYLQFSRTLTYSLSQKIKYKT